MSAGFLARLAQALEAEYGADAYCVQVVFPNRRAGLHFLNTYQQHLPRPRLAPRVLTWEEFLVGHSPAEFPDPLPLLVELYGAYSRLIPGEPFDEFLPLGTHLLADFEEIARYGVAPEQLYQNLADLEALEAAFPLPLADHPSLQRFWQTVAGTEPQGLAQHFVALWQALLPIHKAFTARLEALGWSTPGRATRSLAIALAEGPLPYPVATTWFVGFAEASALEQRILQGMVQHHLGRWWVDGDPWYTHDNPHHQAGEPLRATLARYPALGQQLTPDLATQPRQIISYQVPLKVPQALVAGEHVAQLLGTSPADSIALVVPDETLLLPTLQYLPPDLEAINVTMGYPVGQTEVYGWLDALLALYATAHPAAPGRAPEARAPELRAWLAHPLTRQWCPDAEPELERLLLTARPYSSVTDLPESLQRVLMPPPGLRGLAAYLAEAVRALATGLETHLEAIEAEAALHLILQLQRLAQELPGDEVPLSEGGRWRVVRQLLEGLRIPFSGEPLRGLQVLGFWETQLLDFRHLIVLSANEGTFPPAPPQGSLIPYGLRKAFGLPTPETHEAIHAYHLYRLLQRTESALFVYDGVGQSGGSEPSRYLAQFEIELGRLTPTTYRTVARSAPAVLAPVPDIRFEKTDALRAALTAFVVVPDGPEPTQHLAPTDIGHYLQCPLRFYLSKVRRLAEAEAPEETLGAREIGQWVHRALEVLYTPYLGQELSPQQVKSLARNLDPAIDAATEVLPPGVDLSRGLNHLRRQVVGQLVGHVVRTDAERAPFTPIALEQRLTGTLPLPDGRALALKGTPDRIDTHLGTVWLIDYKTGKVDVKTPSSRKPYPDALLGEGYMPELQVLLYGYLYLQQSSPRPTHLEVGLYGLRRVSQLYQPSKFDLLAADNHQAFEATLGAAVAPMFDPDTPFVQRKGPHCERCPYFALCYYTTAGSGAGL
ncbi:MAG: PD-(D/E)XK nuclease family protein [Bacteroidia bacterium]|nr:PD-(D/E)XK nuclease family protein [Bacteroidia bacterium]